MRQSGCRLIGFSFGKDREPRNRTGGIFKSGSGAPRAHARETGSFSQLGVTTQEMEGGPPKSACRGRLQTTVSGAGQQPGW
jgi:hypothetical protein